MSIDKLKAPPPDPINDNWRPPARYKLHHTAENVVAYWRETTRKSAGKAPDYSGGAMLVQARRLLKVVTYEQALRVLAWMATPASKYYQYPYAIEKVLDGLCELNGAKKVATVRDLTYHTGYIGPTYLRNLGED